VSDGIDWELVLVQETEGLGSMLTIRSSIGGGGGGSFREAVGRGLGDYSFGYLGRLDDRIVALHGVMHRTFRQVRVECVDGSEIPPVSWSIRNWGSTFTSLPCKPPPQRIVATDLLGNGVFINVAETGARFHYRH
jgi:hypothetical protein